MSVAAETTDAQDVDAMSSTDTFASQIPSIEINHHTMLSSDELCSPDCSYNDIQSPIKNGVNDDFEELE